MSDVLVVQPDAPQTEALRTIFRRIGADLIIVESIAEAMDSIGQRLPDVILLSSLLSPIEEDSLMGHLRTLDNASHIQMLRLPQFRREAAAVEEPAKGGFFGRKKKKAKPAAPSGCDPDVFAEEVVAHLLRSNEIRNRPAIPKPVVLEAPLVVEQEEVVEAFSPTTAMATEPEPDTNETSWAAPPLIHDAPSTVALGDESIESPLVFDERPAIAETPVFVDDATEAMAETNVAEAPVETPVLRWAARPSSVSKPAPLSIEADDVDRLAQELGLDLKLVEIDDDPEPVTPTAYTASQEDAFDFAAALDRAREQAEARHQEELARAEADAVAIREAAIAEARALAEREAREAVAADIARIQAEAEQTRLAALAEAEAAREAAIAEARAVAEREAREAAMAERKAREAAIAEAEAARDAAVAEREAREVAIAEAEAAREVAIAEAESARDAAIAEARAVAEREAREALDVELARVRSETQETVANALKKVTLEAQEAERARAEAERARAEADRLRAEAQQALAAEALQKANQAKLEAKEAGRARAEAERLRVEAQEAFAAELARVRAEVEQQLAVQLEASRAEADRMRVAEEAGVRDRAANELQLKAEIDRLKFVAAQSRKADETETRKAADQIKQLERELATVHAKTEQRQQAQLEELRQQMAEMREAAAQHARNAAAEAVASEVARVHAEAQAAPKLNVVRMQPRQQTPMSASIAEPTSEPVAMSGERDSSEPRGGDYYSLWQASEPVEEPVEESEVDDEEPSESRVDFRRHAKWALPAAACLLLVVNTGTISTVARLVGPSPKPPALTVEPLEAEPFIEVVQKRVGRLQIESTPAGAEAIVDGKSYGKTPITIPDLGVGTHTIVLKSSEGSITRRVSVKANETTVIAEAIFSGWLAVFSPISVTAVLDGRPVSLPDDGRLMVGPGKHVLELVSERFNYRSKETLEVRPGETTAYTLPLPTESVRITAPAGAVIRIDGEVAEGIAADGVPVKIGSHQIAAIHPELGERRIEVDVRHGAPADVTVPFE